MTRRVCRGTNDPNVTSEKPKKTLWRERLETWKAITITHSHGSDAISRNIYRKVLLDFEKVLNSHEALLKFATGGCPHLCADENCPFKRKARAVIQAEASRNDREAS